MKVTVEDLSPVLKKLSVEVPAETVDKALDRAYRAVGRKARIRGFRPGKVPRRILEMHYGHQVLHEVAEDLVRETYAEALDQEKIEPVAFPEVEESGHVKPGATWSYSARVSVLPEVRVTDYDGLAGEAPAVAVSADDVDGEIDRIREAMAQLVPVEDRKHAETGDYVVADVEATADGERVDDASGEGFTFEVTEGDLTQGNLPEAAGKALGETVTFTQAFPEDHPSEQLKGKKVSFAATLKQIKRRELPEVDDELAKDLGEEGVDSLLALRGLIRERLSSRRQKDADRQLRDSLLDSLVAKNPIDVPPVLVDRTAEAMVRPVLEQMIRAGLDPEQLGQDGGVRQMLEEVRPRAEKVVKGSLLLRALAEQENLEVADEDVEAHYAEVAEETGNPVEKVRATFKKNAEELESLKRRLLEDKALAFIKDRASISEPGSEGTAGKGEGAAEVEKVEKEAAGEAPAEEAAAPKKTAKKTASKKAATTKTAARKSTTKKTATQKTTTRKAASKKAATKKAPAKKKAAKKSGKASGSDSE